MTIEEQAFMDFCDRQTWRKASQYLHFLIACPMAIAITDPDYQEEF